MACKPFWHNAREVTNQHALGQNRTCTRRTVLALGAISIVAAIGGFIGCSPPHRTTEFRHAQPMMGTIVNLSVCGSDEDRSRAAIAACLKRMTQLSQMMSTYLPSSPIAQLNRTGSLSDAPPELIEVFTLAHRLSELTEGAFDPTVKPLLGLYKTVKKTGTIPAVEEIQEILQLIDYTKIMLEDDGTIRYAIPGMQVTLDGIAKGYIVDQGVQVLMAQGFHNAYVEAGGDLMTIGKKPNGKPWKIGIRNPRSDNLQKMATIDLSDRAIATSGDYLQYFTDDKRAHHIINPKTGFSPINTASSSIIAPTVAMADGLATATMVLGPQVAAELVESLPDCEGYFFDKALNKYSTTGFFS